MERFRDRSIAAQVVARLTSHRPPDVGMLVIKLFPARFYFYLPVWDRSAVKSLRQGTFCSSFFFHSNDVTPLVLGQRNVYHVSVVSFYSPRNLLRNRSHASKCCLEFILVRKPSLRETLSLPYVRKQL